MLLLMLVLIPFFGGILSWISEIFSKKLPRIFSLFIMIVLLIINIFLWKHEKFFIPLNGQIPVLTKQYYISLISKFGINIHFALDGLSFLMIFLTNILGLISIWYSLYDIKKYFGFFYFNLNIIVSAIFGIFLSFNLLLFFLFWEIILIPIFFLIMFWGNKKKVRFKTVSKIFFYSQISSFIMLLSIVCLSIFHNNIYGFVTFDYFFFLRKIFFVKSIENIIMLCYFLSFAIKLPIVPFHGWLCNLHTQVPTSVSIYLSGILLKTSIYGIMRFLLPIFPICSRNFSFLFSILSTISIFYGLFITYSQNDIKKIFACSSISHMNFILIALYSFNILSYYGLLIQIIAHGLSISCLFVICRLLYIRVFTKNMYLIGNLWNRLRIISIFFLFFIITNINFPGSINFVGEILMFLGIFFTYPIISIILSFSIVFSLIYSLNVIKYVLYGSNSLCKKLSDIQFHEKFILCLVIFLVIFLGFYPKFIFDFFLL